MKAEIASENRGFSDIAFHETDAFGVETCPNRTGASAPDILMRLVRHCAPTLAGMKCGSMFRVSSDLRDILPIVSETEFRLSHRGIRMEILRMDEDGCLLYVYRPKRLQAKLDDPEVRSFLDRYGYAQRSLASTLAELCDRFVHCPDMPPEVGVFLDYPIEDIRGYIENEGRCSRCIGCWKVYGDVAAAEKMFGRFRKCKEVYTRRLMEGSSILRLTVRCRCQNHWSRERCFFLSDSFFLAASIFLTTADTFSDEKPYPDSIETIPSPSMTPGFTE